MSFPRTERPSGWSTSRPALVAALLSGGQPSAEAIRVLQAWRPRALAVAALDVLRTG